jgi:hypothetical protein
MYVANSRGGGTQGVGDSMVVFAAVCAILIAALCLGFFTVRKMDPGSFRLHTSIWRVFSFRIEIESTASRKELPGMSPRDETE